MKDINDLLSQFNDLQDLPVSEEMLGAYIEGNLDGSEQLFVESSIQQDDSLNDLVAGTNEDTDSGYDWSIHDGDYGFWELGIPPVVTEDDIKSYEEQPTDGIDFEIDKFFNLINDNNMVDKLDDKYRSIGEHGENVMDPVYIQQPDDHSCALRSQQIVLRDFGIDIPFEQLEKMALDYGVYSDQGTLRYDIGKVLQLAGVGMHQVEGTSLYDLTNELAQGHRIIVSVDADELWYNDSFAGKLRNWFNDTFGHQGGNHALIVAGVEVNPNDPNDVNVVLTDPGAGHLRVEYPLDQFMDAWKDSNCFMAATNDSAPYQYDAETGKEVPSNFFVEQHVNEFIASNSYQLSPDMINIPADYQPAFNGHLDMVGNMDYDSFVSKMKDYNEMHEPVSMEDLLSKWVDTPHVGKSEVPEDETKDDDDTDDEDGDDDVSETDLHGEGGDDDDDDTDDNSTDEDGTDDEDGDDDGDSDDEDNDEEDDDAE